ncbi:MAG: hypothetical protein F6K16_34750 [Symploca sp. SIO2B6]|nr:hypothetical protein [Symploca sp. SIO2B6]
MVIRVAIAIKSTLNWEHHAQYGWVLEGWDAYSLRNADNPDYPFDEWNMLIANIQNLMGSEQNL